MNDITMLGVICIGLGLYCLHLHSRLRKMNNAGTHLVEMLMRYIIEKEECDVREASKILRDIHTRVMSNDIDLDIQVKEQK